VDTNPPTDELQWVVRLKNREAGAWDEFVRQLHDLVHGVIRQTAARRQMKLQPSDVDDLASDVFAAALRSLERFRRESTLSTWLTSITRRVVQRELGRAWRVRVRGDVSHAERADTSSRPPLEDMLLTESNARLEAALEQVPENLRLVLRLHYLQRRSYSEISRQLGISINSVGPALARGRDVLREIMKKEADSAEMRLFNAFDLKRERARQRSRKPTKK